MNKMYGLYYVEVVNNHNLGDAFIPSIAYPERMVAVAHTIDKLTKVVPHVKKWNKVTTDSGEALQYAELADNSKYKILEIPYVC